MSEHQATISWKRSDPDFLKGQYSREHTWTFDGGATCSGMCLKLSRKQSIPNGRRKCGTPRSDSDPLGRGSSLKYAGSQDVRSWTRAIYEAKADDVRPGLRSVTPGNQLAQASLHRLRCGSESRATRREIWLADSLSKRAGTVAHHGISSPAPSPRTAQPARAAGTAPALAQPTASSMAAKGKSHTTRSQTAIGQAMTSSHPLESRAVGTSREHPQRSERAGMRSMRRSRCPTSALPVSRNERYRPCPATLRYAPDR